MGAYLSEPVVEKITCDEKNDKLGLSYGASSMQGWRVSQEDAHNTILDFDTDTSFFAVYDGHGGHEVATYCALNLPDFIKNLDVYKKGDLIKALEEGYLEFDKTLTREDVIKVLHVVAGNKSKDASSEEDPDEMNELYEEATMSIEDLLMKYGSRKKESDEEGEGLSRSSHMEYLVSKLCAKAKKSKNSSETSPTQETTKAAEEESKDESDGGAASKAKSKNTDSKREPSVPSEACVKDENGEHKSENGTKPKSDDHAEKEEPQDVINGSLQNGSDHNNDSLATTVIPTKGKGKGIGKGLSNAIRKPVEKTPEELEQERKEAEKQAKRKERKESLRKKSGDELYRAIVSNEEEGEEDSDMDDEEDVDFDGESDSEAAEDGDDDEDEWEDMEEEEEEEDEEEVAAKARNFTMNLKEEPGSDSGCTAVVALLRGNTLHVANAGDSRCVLSRSGVAIPLSADHKPEDEPERSRIQRAGGVVTGDGRVNGGLNLSRAIGDHAYKQNETLGPREQMITALPDIQTIDLEQGDEFLVLACDGIWNSKTNQEVVDFVRARLEKNDCLSQICNELFEECLAPDTRGDGTGCDNMTAIIVRLDRFRSTEEKTETTSLSSLKRAHSEEKSAEGLQEEKEDEATHKSKKQRVEDSGSEESATSSDAGATSS